ncbi:ABC-F family ATP-binding cassette domain-containing protein [Paeniglutamicibacter psychrophenolicus]|uniref:ABC-F family ATP-binding cassette domain-containing protein n=1 Tax=Paeniglutamicibacter psychrophenolicus TaxID=257454 RepID=UPI00277F8BCE|nr:ABC-F family ATP-binding cassette domain-containing protein [Paeniglutamicibacter psychrophenolicus]MDQ0092634.1 ATPase subunit of ABC transporter with duplicated ATPase domains [Paeniglutamicibacter psychrophenolicus]
MAHLLGAENVSMSFGTRTVLDSLSLGLEDGDRIGMVGRNGDGKSTLMRLLAGRMGPDEGRVTKRGDVRVAYLDQTDVLDGALSVGEAIVGEAADHEWASNPLVREVMGGLVGEVDWHAEVNSLSGGQKRRVALAKLLIGDHEVIMLDEPTNHLDVEGVAWLAAHLKNRWRANQNGLLVVTHDRWFLDEICTRTWEVHDGTVDPFDGGYAAYVLARAERDKTAAVVENKRQQLVKKELAWLRRGAPARTAKPKFRIEAANTLIADVPAARDTVELNKMATARLGKDVLDLENVSLDFGTGKPLFNNITLRLAPGERLGIVGVNGAGKSTLLQLLNGQIEPTSGVIKRGKTVKTAILTQEVKELDEIKDMRLIEVIKAERMSFEVGGKEVSAGQLAEQLGFGTDKQWTTVKELSGGERRRLQLLRLLIGEPNVLMLDEPTNDLDTDTLAAIEDMLDGWPGTLVVVSHDRYLLERVTDHQLALLGDGKLRGLPGGVDQYLELRAGVHGTTNTGAPTDKTGPAATPEAAGPTEAEKREARKELNRVERQMGKLESLIKKLHTEMAVASEAMKFDHVATLNATLQGAQSEKDELEMAWLEAAETLGE